ncbi:MAG: sialidase family protein [Polyangiaceae bacterium]
MRRPLPHSGLAGLALALFGLSALPACHRTPDAPTPTAQTPDAALAAHVDSKDPSVLSQSLETAAQIEPSLAVTSDGKVAIAWMSAVGERSSVIGLRFSSDGGTTWGAVKKISSPDGRTASDPVIKADQNGVFYVAWRATGPDGTGGTPDSHIYVARSEASDAGSSAGEVLGAPVDVTDHMRGGARLARPSLAVTGTGAIVVAWSYTSPLGDGIAVARSEDGKSWTKSIVIERIELRATLPFATASAHGNRVWVTYLDSEAGVRLRASEDGGATWSPARGATVSAPEDRKRIGVDTPVCVGDADDVAVAYGLVHDANATALDTIVIAKSSDGGRTFDERRTLEGGSMSMMHPALAREPDGALDLAFYATGATPDTGALRWLHAERDRSPLGPSKVARASFRFEPATEAHNWPGAYFGWEWQGGSLYAASIDNSGDMAHVAFTRIGAASANK